MPGRRGTAAVLRAALLAAGTAGCATVFGSFDYAPNGLARREDGLRALLMTGRADSALGSVRFKAEAAPSDDLLRLLYQGLIARYAGRHEESVWLLDHAAALAEDRYTKSVARGALSLITNDRVLAYNPGVTERLLIHYYAALGYLDQDLLDDAAVEARRMSAVLARLGEDSLSAQRSDQFAFFHAFAGLVFEAAGYDDAARVAYRNAAHLRGTPSADSLTLLPRDSGEVIVFVEQGFVAHRVENSIILELLPDEVQALSAGNAGEKLGAALLVSARVLSGVTYAGAHWQGEPRAGATIHIPRPVVHESSPATLEPRRPVRHVRQDSLGKRDRDDDDEDEEDDEDYILRLAWPSYVDARDAARASLAGSAGTVGEVLATDVSEGVIADFDAERALVLARAIVRGAAKFAATRVAEQKAEQETESETAGEVVGLIANIGAVLTERADTRSWHLLPERISIVRMRLPAGEHTLELRFGDRRVETLQMDVAGGGFAFASARSWR